MRYLAGDSYGQIENTQLATDAARDNRFFQSLQANRAAEAQQMQQQQMEQEAAYRQALMEQHAQDQQQSYMMNLQARQDQNAQFDKSQEWHRGNLKLEQDKFDFSKTQPTPAQIQASEREYQQAQEANNRFTFGKSLADIMNQYQDTALQKQEIDRKVAELTQLPADYEKNYYRLNPFGDSKAQWQAKLDAYGAPKEDDFKKRAELAQKSFAAQSAQLQAKMDTLGTLIGQSKAGADVLARNEQGKYVSTVPQPPPFDFSKMRTPLSVRPGMPTPAPVPTKAAVVPAPAFQFPAPSFLPPPVNRMAQAPVAPSMMPSPPAEPLPQLAPGNGGSPTIDQPVGDMPLDQRSGYARLDLQPTNAPALPSGMPRTNAQPTMDFSRGSTKLTPESARGMVKVLVTSGMEYKQALATVKAMMARQAVN